MSSSFPQEDATDPQAEPPGQMADTPGREATPPPAGAEASGPGDAEIRRLILQCLQARLDSALSDEPPPQGIPAEILSRLQGGAAGGQGDGGQTGCDLYSLFSALVALTQEAKLQGRAFAQLRDRLLSVESLDGSVASMLTAHEEALSAVRQMAEDSKALQEKRQESAARAARDDARQEVLDLLLDMRDRLARGLTSARAHVQEICRRRRIGWLGRLLRKAHRSGGRLFEATVALEKGHSLALERLDDVLEELGVCPIPCEGRPFDPQLMTAVDVEVTSGAPEGTVLEVYRPGYEWRGRVWRPAEVKVARTPRDVQAAPIHRPVGPHDGPSEKMEVIEDG